MSLLFAIPLYVFAFIGLAWSMLIAAVMVSAYLSRRELERQTRRQIEELINQSSRD